MYEEIKRLETPDKIKTELPVPPQVASARSAGVEQIKNILAGSDNRKLFIVGPCSADSFESVTEYAQKLSRVACEVRDRLFVIMRVHTVKPRTRGLGYMGMLHTPDIATGITDIASGMEKSRKLHIAVAQTGLCTSDELLYPEFAEYIDDTVSYFTVGARSAEDQSHRFAASAADVPVGIKNPVNGCIADIVGSVRAAKSPSDFIFRGRWVRSSGNAYAHAILRGANGMDGNCITNYGKAFVSKLLQALRADGDCNPSVIIDAGHSNSNKRAEKQPTIVSAVLEYMSRSAELNRFVKGFMAESYLLGGSGEAYGMSRTDACLGFADTEAMLYRAADAVKP